MLNYAFPSASLLKQPQLLDLAYGIRSLGMPTQMPQCGVAIYMQLMKIMKKKSFST